MPRNQLFFLRVEIDEFFFSGVARWQQTYFYRYDFGIPIVSWEGFWQSLSAFSTCVLVTMVPYKFGEAIPAIPFPSLPNIFWVGFWTPKHLSFGHFRGFHRNSSQTFIVEDFVGTHRFLLIDTAPEVFYWQTPLKSYRFTQYPERMIFQPSKPSVRTPSIGAPFHPIYDEFFGPSL